MPIFIRQKEAAAVEIGVSDTLGIALKPNLDGHPLSGHVE
jgi:hypothetical protein